jgi:hypothetical protein
VQELFINPEDAGAWCNLGTAYGKVGQTAKAIEPFNRLSAPKRKWCEPDDLKMDPGKLWNSPKHSSVTLT